MFPKEQTAGMSSILPLKRIHIFYFSARQYPAETRSLGLITSHLYSREGRSDWAKLDVGVGDRGAWRISLDIGGDTGGDWAFTTRGAEFGAVGWVG